MAVYTAIINAVAVSAAQDLFSIKAGATYPFLLHSVNLSQKTLTAVEGKQLLINRLTSTFTQGSGGSAPTAIQLSPGGAATTTAGVHINDTTPGTTNGTTTNIYSDVWQFLNGYLWQPYPEDRPYFAINTGCVISLPTAPSASMTVSGTIVWEELGV